MSRISQSAIMPYTVSQMYALVRDVPSYPLFLPWCAASEVHEQSEEMQLATLTLSQGPIRQAFTTRNACVPDISIEMQLVDGPFSHLQGQWHFMPEVDGSRVDLHLDFSVGRSLLAKPLAMVFAKVTQQMVDAFVQRARVLYGD